MKLEFSRRVLLKIPKNQILWKSVHWEPSCFMRTDRQTDWRIVRQTDRQTERHDGDNSRVSQFCETRPKKRITNKWTTTMARKWTNCWHNSSVSLCIPLIVLCCLRSFCCEPLLCWLATSMNNNRIPLSLLWLAKTSLHAAVTSLYFYCSVLSTCIWGCLSIFVISRYLLLIPQCFDWLAAFHLQLSQAIISIAL